MIRWGRWAGTALLVFVAGSSPPGPAHLHVLFLGGRVLDGAGNPWVWQDVGVAGDRIVFVGHARVAGVQARDTVELDGLYLAPGFWDVHSHADLTASPEALPQLYQGITTVVTGIDGGGGDNLAELFGRYEREGIAVNVARYVGHNAARRTAMGTADRPPTPRELERMKAFVEKGMREGALGLSSGLFYVPGTYAATEEVIELNRVAARYGGIYDTHDRDLGASYQGVGYEASVEEAIRIGEEAGTPVIFSHFNLQGAHNYGRAHVGERLVEEARARGVNVMAGHHPYTATHSSLSAYALPRWASAGGEEEMLARFRDPEIRARLDVETMEMLVIRGGAEKLVFTARDPELNGRTLGEVAAGWALPVPEAVRRILAQGGASVMNRDLYDDENTKYLARMEWMMTCTDGGIPAFGEGIVHPRSYGAFPNKLRRFVVEEGVITLPFAIRGMTSLAAAFLGFPGRGVIREGVMADLVAFDLDRVNDPGSYEDPHHYAQGMVHVMVNGAFAMRDGEPTGVRAGRPLRGPGAR